MIKSGGNFSTFEMSVRIYSFGPWVNHRTVLTVESNVGVPGSVSSVTATYNPDNNSH